MTKLTAIMSLTRTQHKDTTRQQINVNQTKHVGIVVCRKTTVRNAKLNGFKFHNVILYIRGSALNSSP